MTGAAQPEPMCGASLMPDSGVTCYMQPGHTGSHNGTKAPERGGGRGPLGYERSWRMGDVENARYRANPRQCIDCAGPPSAGRPRCNTCHDKRHHHPTEGQQQ